MAVIKITKDNFEEIKNQEKAVLIDLYADWCGPCKMLAPIVAEIADENDDIIVGKINVDEESELAAAFSVMSIPMLVVLKDGKIYNKAIGYRGKEEILSLLK